MTWLHPEWLAATWGVAALALVVLAANALHNRRVDAAFGRELALRVLPAGTRRRRSLRDLLLLLGLVGACLALAEPAFDKQIVNVQTEGVDMVFALDLSRSMDADDVDPSRLERARREIQDLLDIVVGDRVAVVFFAGEAIGRLPLTEDYKAVAWVLGEADTSMFKAQGSSVAKALDVAREMLSRDEGKAGKAVVIFSDGETHAPEEALEAARKAEEAGITVYTVAIGDATSTIPTRDGGVLTHEGQVVKTVPDFATLEEVARITGGAIVKSVPAASDMERLYRSEIRSKVRAARRETQQTENWRSAYQVPLGVGLGAWLLGLWLGDGRRAFGAATVALLALQLASSPAMAAPPGTLEEADEAFRAGDFRRAERAFEEIALDRPNDADVLDRLAASRYRLGDWTGAASAWERASALRGGDADALYNAGNARYKGGQLEAAMERYTEAEQAAPGHEQAAQNHSVVAQELEERRRQKPPEPPSPSQGGEDENEGGSGEDEPENPTPGDQGSDDPQDGDGQGEGEQDQQSNDGSADAGDQQQQQPNPGDGSQGGQQPDQPAQDAPNEGVSPDQMDAEGDQGEQEQEAEGSSQASESGMGEAQGDITPTQAGRMLDAVEEGRQRVQFVGREGAKPW